ncbi:relaxase/mobilization nuclease domain-containing protein [Actinomadura sp. LD22]|uniref:Relaxase/mobilization nuclease domain-containing protein n=1 Tax=Actinomadura physcomitrii TaxID=2650748 RepID=A0A6I4M3T5_9ACTN|nr:relaxase/mobilization nuclease domain-containing protein [Actinomadura physcomitrii]MVZ99034.1 relaxase/mobilization nuclease domain-containing protein [Actinomadura physcomitrii]
MIGKVLRGVRVQGLLRYLYGPGANGEHRDPHIVAGFDDPTDLEPPTGPDGRDFRRLDGLLTQPLALLGERNYRKPVWHCAVRAAPEDPILTDAQWAQVATEIMHRTGLAPDGDLEAVRWIAVRHADDHVHIVATLARSDGIRPEVWNDGYRVRDACRAVEQRYGLRSTAPADRTAARRPKRGETEKAVRRGQAVPSRTLLHRTVQTAAAGARSEEEFFDRLTTEGVLVRRRYSQRTTGQVTGYAVALAGDVNAEGQPVWYGGGKLAADLTLPRLRRRWTNADGSVRAPSAAGPLDGRHLSARTKRVLLRTTVRRAADKSRTTAEFMRRLQDDGLWVKPRYSRLDPGQITGYAVAFPTEHHSDEPAWIPGSRLAAGLSLSRLQQRWSTGTAHPEPPLEHDDLTQEERQAIYDDAARAAAHATAEIRRHLATNPYAAQDACWAASDALHAAAQATGNHHLRRAADAYDRAARAPYGRIPRPTPAGDALRTTARLLAITGSLRNRTAVTSMMLVANLIALLDTIAELRWLQQRQAQADAARRAAVHVREARSAAGTPMPRQSEPTATPSQVSLAMAGFPMPWAPMTPAARPAQTGPVRPVRNRKGL